MSPAPIILPATNRTVTPAEDGAAAYLALDAAWRAAWEGRGWCPSVTCRWPGHADMLAWCGGYMAAVDRGKRAWAAELTDANMAKAA